MPDMQQFLCSFFKYGPKGQGHYNFEHPKHIMFYEHICKLKCKNEDAYTKRETAKFQGSIFTQNKALGF